MNAALALFPTATTLLCLWHVNKAVLARCMLAFPAVVGWQEFYSYWHSIIGSPIEEEYFVRLVEFQQKYVPGHLEEVGYIKAI